MPIHDAIIEEDLEAVEALLEGGTAVDATALQLAVSVKNVAILDVLMQCGDVDVNVVDNSGRSLLHLATATSNTPGDGLAVLQLVLATGVDPNHRDNAGNTALHNLCDPRINRNGATAAEIRALLDADADPLVTNAKGHTPLRTLLIPTYAPAPPGTQERLLGPAAAALWAAGDRACWRLIPRGCRGLEQGLVAMMRGCPEDVPLLMERMRPEAKFKARCIMKVLDDHLFDKDKKQSQLRPDKKKDILEHALML